MVKGNKCRHCGKTVDEIGKRLRLQKRLGKNKNKKVAEKKTKANRGEKFSRQKAQEWLQYLLS